MAIKLEDYSQHIDTQYRLLLFSAFSGPYGTHELEEYMESDENDLSCTKIEGQTTV